MPLAKIMAATLTSFGTTSQGILWQSLKLMEDPILKANLHHRF